MYLTYEVINRNLTVKKELILSYVFFETDQAIYAKALNVMLKLENENNKLFDKITVRFT